MLIVSGFQKFHLTTFTFNEHMSCTLCPGIYTYKIGYIMHLSEILLFNVLWIKVLVNF